MNIGREDSFQSDNHPLKMAIRLRLMRRSVFDGDVILEAKLPAKCNLNFKAERIMLGLSFKNI